MPKPLAVALRGHPEKLWPQLRQEAVETKEREPKMANTIDVFITSRVNFSDALAYLLAEELANAQIDAGKLHTVITESHAADPGIVTAAQFDLIAVIENDPSAVNLMAPFLFFKGYHALQAYRTSHWLWKKGQKAMATWIQGRLSRHLGVDIHPAAVLGKGIMIDHAHGIVIGETAVVEDNVSMLHNVTLGAISEKAEGDRHPKIRSGVVIGAGAVIIGNIEVGAGARVAASSMVLKNVPPFKTVAGVPARVIGTASTSLTQTMSQMFGDEGSSI